MTEYIHTTKQEYKTLEELSNADFDYDYYISGSDQIWNPVPADFDWAYYLPWVKNGKRIAYAPSFGQMSSIGNEHQCKKMKKYLSKYDSISVREQGSKDNILKLIHKNVDIVLDPTLLLSKQWWDNISAEPENAEGDYIFLYTLFATPQIISIARYFSKTLGLSVVTSNFSNQYDVFTPYKKRFNSGPREFLGLIKNASLVLTSSFHGMVFASIYQKPFFAIEGDKDARISTLLAILDLPERSVNIYNCKDKAKNGFDIKFDYSKFNKIREHSMMYLRKALDCDGNMQ